MSVLDSTTTAPALAPLSAPSYPSQISREAASSATIAMTTSAPSAASRGVAATRAPLSSSACALARVRFQTVRSKPLASQLAAMPAPIVPRPRSATRRMRCSLRLEPPVGWMASSCKGKLRETTAFAGSALVARASTVSCSAELGRSGVG